MKSPLNKKKRTLHTDSNQIKGEVDNILKQIISNKQVNQMIIKLV